MKLITIKCPKCGNELHVQNEIETVFCNYCGEQISVVSTATNKMSAEGKMEKQSFSELVNAVGGTVQKTANNVGNVVGSAVDGVAVGYNKAQKAILNAIDENGNGEIDIEDVIIKGLKTPGIRINRENFLRKELSKNCSAETVTYAIEHTPMEAGITRDEVDKIADEVIQYERTFVSGIAAALGAPGGIAMVATIPADIAQYYGYLLRATQKMLYLYGFPQIDVDEKEQHFDTETINILILCMGIMYGAAGANNALKAMANALGKGVEKKLLRMALTKGAVYPIVKSVAHWFGVNMTKEVFAGFFKNSIPVVGGVLGGGITYLTFKPCCDKLKNSLRDTRLSNPNYIESAEEIATSDAIARGSDLSSDIAEEKPTFVEAANKSLNDGINIVKSAGGVIGGFFGQSKSIKLPSGYKQVRLEPKDPLNYKNPIRYYKKFPSKQTLIDYDEASVVISSFEGNEIDIPFMSPASLIDHLHKTMSENEGIIEVDNGVTLKGKLYLYSLLKEKINYLNITEDMRGRYYFLHMYIKCATDIIEVSAKFAGRRYDKRLIEGTERFEQDKAVNPLLIETEMYQDPYDSNYRRFDGDPLMAYIERKEFDSLYSDDILTAARNFIAEIYEKN